MYREEHRYIYIYPARQSRFLNPASAFSVIIGPFVLWFSFFFSLLPPENTPNNQLRDFLIQNQNHKRKTNPKNFFLKTHHERLRVFHNRLVQLPSGPVQLPQLPGKHAFSYSLSPGGILTVLRGQNPPKPK